MEGPKGLKVFTFQDVENHSLAHDCWLLIGGKVYDVTSFLMDHPGGHAILLSATGKEAQEDFDDVGHSDSAKKLMQEYLIGTLDSSSISPGPNVPTFRKLNVTQSSSYEFRDTLIRILQFLVPLALLALVLANNYFKKKREPSEL